MPRFVDDKKTFDELAARIRQEANDGEVSAKSKREAKAFGQNLRAKLEAQPLKDPADQKEALRFLTACTSVMAMLEKPNIGPAHRTPQDPGHHDRQSARLHALLQSPVRAGQDGSGEASVSAAFRDPRRDARPGFGRGQARSIVAGFAEPAAPRPPRTFSRIWSGAVNQSQRRRQRTRNKPGEGRRRLMADFLKHLFDTSDFPRRWDCGNWTPEHGWLHVLSDVGVWSAYVAIPLVLGYFVLRRRDIPFRGIFWLFAAFILACGTTHLMEAIIFWWPAYRLAGVIKLFTAIISWVTVIALVPVTPKVLAMRSPDELEREIGAREEVEVALKQANAELESQIEALRASEERFRLLVDGSKDHAIFMLDPTGHIVSWNPGASA